MIEVNNGCHVTVKELKLLSEKKSGEIVEKSKHREPEPVNARFYDEDGYPVSC